MQTIDDDFPFSSDDPSLAPAEEINTGISLNSQQLDDLKATMRLVVGSALNGRDAYILRLRRVQSAQESVRPEGFVIDENESSLEQLRYLFLGMLFETPDLIQRGLQSTERASLKVYRLFSKMLSPITNRRVFNPVRTQYEKAAARGENTIDRLIMKGRIEEQNSRQVLQQKNIDDLVNELLEYVILKTEAAEIIQETGVGVAGGVLDDFRGQSAAVELDPGTKTKIHLSEGC